MQKTLYIIAGISGFLAVAIGAFGAHGLKALLEQNQKLETFQTGVQYHFYHTFVLFITAFLLSGIDSKLLNWAGWSFLSGIILFSGSLYILSVTNISKLGAVTPIGGLGFLAGWTLIVIAVIKNM